MKYIKYKTNPDSNETSNVFWVTMSDLLLGLVVIFLVLFVFAITGFTQNKINEKESQYIVVEKIAQELKKNNFDVDIDKFAGTIKISDLELFELNSWELSPKGKEFMSKFVPIYFNTIMTDKNIAQNISQIVIEGHTDSHNFAGASSKEEQFYRNMDLSLKRASSVAQYIIYSKYNGKDTYEKDMLKLLSVTGKGSSNPIMVNNQEDYAKSRRVELKITFKDKSIIDSLKK